MFSGFLGKGKKPDSPANKDAVDSRGLEVVEDDPDTTWGMWQNAVAEQDSRFPTIQANLPAPDAGGNFLRTVPLPIMEGVTDTSDRTPAQRREDALQVVELHHNRIAKSIRSLWGYPECSQYIAKLIMDGGYREGHARMGFNQEAAQAMMVLADLHDTEFGSTPQGDLGFPDSMMRSSFDGNR